MTHHDGFHVPAIWRTCPVHGCPYLADASMGWRYCERHSPPCRADGCQTKVPQPGDGCGEHMVPCVIDGCDGPVRQPWQRCARHSPNYRPDAGTAPATT